MFKKNFKNFKFKILRKNLQEPEQRKLLLLRFQRAEQLVSPGPQQPGELWKPTQGKTGVKVRTIKMNSKYNLKSF